MTYNPYGPLGGPGTTTSSTTTCSPSYQSVTLQTGQSFILPPGATIVGASVPTNIQTDCADLLNLEQLECYVISMIGADQQDGAQTQAWDNDNNNTLVRSIIVQGVEYSINRYDLLGDGGEFFTCQIKSFIDSHPVLSNLLLCTGCAEEDAAGDRGGIGELCFKAIPSIGTQTFIQVSTTLPIGAGVSSIANFVARLRSSYNPSGAAKCSCGC